MSEQFTNEDRRQKLLQLVTEAVRVLREQGEQIPGGSPVPPSPVPPAPATNTAGAAPPVDPNAAPPQAPADPNQPKPFDVDGMIDRLNVVRGGKSFADPEVYGQLTSYFKGLSEPDKQVIDRFLQSINKIVIQVDTPQAGGPGGQQPVMNQQPGGVAPPIAAAPAPGGAPSIAEGLEEDTPSEVLSKLNESLKPGVKFAINGKEFEIGSPEHLKILKGILMGLQALRDCHNIGTANRHVYSSASAKLRRHLEALSSK